MPLVQGLLQRTEKGTEHTYWAVKLLSKDMRLGACVCQND